MSGTDPAVSGIALTDVRYRYAGGQGPALDGVSLAVAPGEVVGLIGPNEAGKSTVCLVASGLAPTVIGGRIEGSVTIDGIDTAHARPHDVAQRCGILFQNASTQLSGTTATVWEEIAFGPRNLGLPLDEIVRRVDWVLDLLRIGHLAARDPGRLSGGQAQLVALGAVLALRPGCVVLDEPTAQLDPEGTRLVGEALRALAETGAALLVVEHKTDLLEGLCDRVAVVDGGRIAIEGATAAVLADPRLVALGVEPPSRVGLARMLEERGIDPAVVR